MTVSCPDCRSVFRVDPAKVPATGVRARCSVCGGIMAVPGGTGPVRPPVPAVSAPPVTPASHVITRTPPLAGQLVSPAPSAISPRVATPAAAPGRIARMTPPLAPTAVGTPFAPTASAAPAPAGALTPAGGTAAAALPTSAPAGSPRRAINPFLHADPGQRARRLARALVSDLVAYHPRKREEGLAQGTLRPLFRAEIKKSYEEYVEQVGKELAETTPHFQDALNDILAGGQRLF
jgi:predicted Zn finger-like uncharacterized protein